MAMGVPLGLAIAMDARTVAARAAALGAVPVLVLTGSSRSRVVDPRRSASASLRWRSRPDRGRWLGKLGPGRGGARGSWWKGALQRGTLRGDGVSTAVAHRRGDEPPVIVLVVVAGFTSASSRRRRPGASLPVGAQAPDWFGGRRRRPGRRRDVRRIRSLASRWQEFKSPPTVTGSDESLGVHFQRRGPRSWVSSVHASRPLLSSASAPAASRTGAEIHATRRESVRNAHAHAETLAELGIQPLGLIALIFVAGARGAAAGQGRPRVLAGVTARRRSPSLPVSTGSGTVRSCRAPAAPRGLGASAAARRLVLVGFAVIALGFGVGAAVWGVRTTGTCSQPRGAHQPHLGLAPGEHALRALTLPPLHCSARWSWSCAATSPARCGSAAERKEPTNWALCVARRGRARQRDAGLPRCVGPGPSQGPAAFLR